MSYIKLELKGGINWFNPFCHGGRSSLYIMGGGSI